MKAFVIHQQVGPRAMAVGECPQKTIPYLWFDQVNVAKPVNDMNFSASEGTLKQLLSQICQQITISYKGGCQKKIKVKASGWYSWINGMIHNNLLHTRILSQWIGNIFLSLNKMAPLMVASEYQSEPNNSSSRLQFPPSCRWHPLVDDANALSTTRGGEVYKKQ